MFKIYSMFGGRGVSHIVGVCTDIFFTPASILIGGFFTVWYIYWSLILTFSISLSGSLIHSSISMGTSISDGLAK